MCAKRQISQGRLPPKYKMWHSGFVELLPGEDKCLECGRKYDWMTFPDGEVVYCYRCEDTWWKESQKLKKEQVETP